MLLSGTIFLAANTARSQAYAQALENKGIRVGKTIYFDGKKKSALGKIKEMPLASCIPEGIFCPEFSVPLIETCRRISDAVHVMDANHIDDPKISSFLNEVGPTSNLIIYSGFGGQIVPRSLLNIGPPFLHLHAGWLPTYRGSTTIYYSLLQEQRCGVSAMLLSPGIDEGPIIDRCWYPPPLDGDIDFQYDTSIRADFLVKVLLRWRHTEQFSLMEQNPRDAMTYYVIHPVLKHLAILSLKN